MHDIVEPSGSPRPWRQYICVEPLVENAAPAENRTAAETPRKKHETNLAACNWQIRKTPRISTVDPPGYRSARRAKACHADGTHGDDRASYVIDGVIREKAAWDQH